MRLSNGVLSFLITASCYVLFFFIAFQEEGDESTNTTIAAATFIAMTFIVNFPLSWLFIYKIVKEIRWKSNVKQP